LPAPFIPRAPPFAARRPRFAARGLPAGAADDYLARMLTDPPPSSPTAPPAPPVRVPLLVLYVFATLVGLAGAWQHLEGMAAYGQAAPLAHGMAMRMPVWYAWAAAFPFLQWFVRRVPLGRHRWLPAALLYAALGAAVVAAHREVVELVQRLLPPSLFTMGSPFPRHHFDYYGQTLLNDLPLYGALLGLAYLLEYYGRFRERELAASELGRQLAEAQLQALRMQLNPHFLFNAMNSIAMLVRGQRNPEAVRMLAGLSDLLRSVLEERPMPEVPLRDELRFLERYLEIERVRCADRLQVRVEVEPELLDASVPNLILQPLVENAIKHGVARRSQATLVRIGAERRNGTVVLSVRDDGPGLEPEPREGVGLRNTRARLARMYGEHQRMELAGGEDGGAVATIELPYRRWSGDAQRGRP
jgi:two-component system LytT family sensor kinase